MEGGTGVGRRKSVDADRTMRGVLPSKPAWSGMYWGAPPQVSGAWSSCVAEKPMQSQFTSESSSLVSRPFFHAHTSRLHKQPARPSLPRAPPPSLTAHA